MGSLTDLKTNKTLFIACECRSEVLMIEYDHQLEIADLVIYGNSAAHNHKLSLWQKICLCCRILINKSPYKDQMVLSNKQLVDLKNFLCNLGLNKAQ
jgi:hypothetical protein